MILDLALVVIDYLQPPSLPHVEVLLGEDVLKTLAVRVYLIGLAIEIVSLDF